MASIKLMEDGRFRVRAIDGQGEGVELFFPTHIEAQAIANVENANHSKYYEEFEVIDGMNQHKDGYTFVQWLRRKA